uniref:Uncharacterized protein n=2 Tax=Tetradesmus obliquus TaxID=3088 RepID=A0A383W0X1_TETOB|eukprot:jgi/Sobl393_1/19998/SZX70732.1
MQGAAAGAALAHRNTAVVFDPEAPLLQNMHQLHSFASWLPSHVHLVSSITANKAALKRGPDDEANVTATTLYCMHTICAQPLLALALQPAVSAAAAAAAAAPPRDADADADPSTGSQAGDSEQAAPQQQHVLRLASFSSNYAGMPVLQALPAHSLTRLQFDLAGLCTPDYPGVSTQVSGLLARLSNLQELQIDDTRSSSSSSSFPAGRCLAAIAQLRKLTQLRLNASNWTELQQPLQQLLEQQQPLPLRKLHLELPERYVGSVDMSALTQLQEFAVNELHPAMVLPRQLRSLQLTRVQMPGRLAPLTALQQLQRLRVHINIDHDATEAVQRLAAALPALQPVALAYDYAWDAMIAAPRWKQITQLRQLCFVQDAAAGGPPAYLNQIYSILEGVAAATSLTKLELEEACLAHKSGAESQEWVPGAACRQLARLTGLKDLCITERSLLPPGDALKLTALTNLTRLVLDNVRVGVGDAAAALIAQHLTQLRHLDLWCCELGSTGWDCAELEHLVQLTKLPLEGNEQLSSVALSCVMGLRGKVHVRLDAEQRA